MVWFKSNVIVIAANKQSRRFVDKALQDNVLTDGRLDLPDIRERRENLFEVHLKALKKVEGLDIAFSKTNTRFSELILLTCL
jgi:cell division protease FtsH